MVPVRQSIHELAVTPLLLLSMPPSAIFSGQGSRRSPRDLQFPAVRRVGLHRLGGVVARNMEQGPRRGQARARFVFQNICHRRLPTRKHEICELVLRAGRLCRWPPGRPRGLSPACLSCGQTTFFSRFAQREPCPVLAHSRNISPRWRSNSPCPGLTRLGAPT